MPAQAEVYANQPTGTVTAGGTTTSDTAFTVTTVNNFPVASTSATPNTVFRIIDPALPTEIMLVTASSNGTGQSWTVARAQEGTSGVAHAASWTCVQVVTQGSLGLFKENTAMGPASVVSISAVSTETVVVSWTPPAQDRPAAGVCYEASGYGTLSTSSAAPILTWRLRWGGAGGTLLCAGATASQGTALGTSIASGGVYVEGYVNCLSSTSMVAGLNWITEKTTTLYTGVTASNVATGAMAGITVSGSGPLVLTAQFSATTANVLTLAGMIQRVA